MREALAESGAAEKVGEVELMRSAETLLADVPAPAEGEGLPQFPAGNPWASTIGRRADHDALWRRVAALRKALEKPEEPAEDDGEGTPAESGEESGTPGDASDA